MYVKDTLNIQTRYDSLQNILDTTTIDKDDNSQQNKNKNFLDETKALLNRRTELIRIDQRTQGRK